MTVPIQRSSTLGRIDGRWLAAYRTALAEIDRWATRKADRTESLRRYYDRQGKDSISAQVLIDKDQEVREAQLMLERATARAAALGPAAILEAQGFMR